MVLWWMQFKGLHKYDNIAMFFVYLWDLHLSTSKIHHVKTRGIGDSLDHNKKMKIFCHVTVTSRGYTQTKTHFHWNLLCTWFWHILYSTNMHSQLSNDFIRGKRFKSRNAFHLSNQEKANCKARLKSRNVPLNVSPTNKFIAMFFKPLWSDL